MTAQRALVLTVGMGLFAVMPLADSTAAEAATPIPLGSLRDVAKIESLFLVVPGIEPFATRPTVVPAIQPQPQPPPRVIAPIPGMPRDGGTNLDGLLRDPRASRVTPAGLRLADPGWMRKAPAERR